MRIVRHAVFGVIVIVWCQGCTPLATVVPADFGEFAAALLPAAQRLMMWIIHH